MMRLVPPCNDVTILRQRLSSSLELVCVTGISFVFSTVCSGADQGEHQSSASGDRWIPLWKGQSRGKCFHLMTSSCTLSGRMMSDEDVMTWQRFPLYGPFVLGVNQGPVDSPHKEPVTWTDVFVDVRRRKLWTNSGITGDLRNYYAHMTSLLC